MPHREIVRRTYVLIMSGVGLLLLVAGLWRLPEVEQLPLFVALALLAILVQVASTSSEITYEVGGAISLAAAPLFGPLPAALAAIVSHAGFWLLNNYRNFPGWRLSLEQIGFNSGMHGLSIFLASYTLLYVQAQPGTENLLTAVAPWILAAIVADQTNLWLIIGMVSLQHNLKPSEVWWENRWAMPINVLVTAVGGGMLAFAMRELQLAGLVVFFLPVLLSAYAFRLYINRTSEQMAKLEELVALRTQALADSNRALEELHKQKDAFLAVLTHDMRSPLTSIHGYASILRDYPDLTSDQRQNMANIILRNEQTLLEIVDNILDIEQLQSGAPIVLDRESFDLRALVIEVVQASRAKSDEKQISLLYQLDEQPIYVHADRPKLQRIVQNLVSNAIKYTPEKGNINVMTCRNGQYTHVEVRDTGLGIPDEDLPYIFDRYRRVSKHRNMAMGTGLGLAIVKSLVDAHGGEIQVQSQEGVGSTFTVKIPV